VSPPPWVDGPLATGSGIAISWPCEVIAPTLSGHNGGPAYPSAWGSRKVADAGDRSSASRRAGGGRRHRHLVGNSMGGCSRARTRQARTRDSSVFATPTGRRRELGAVRAARIARSRARGMVRELAQEDVSADAPALGRKLAMGTSCARRVISRGRRRPESRSARLHHRQRMSSQAPRQVVGTSRTASGRCPAGSSACARRSTWILPLRHALPASSDGSRNAEFGSCRASATDRCGTTRARCRDNHRNGSMPTSLALAGTHVAGRGIDSARGQRGAPSRSAPILER